MAENPTYTDRQLFLRIAEGDEQAFRQVFNAYSKKLFPFINALVKSDSDAREIIQEVFLKLWLQKSALATIDNPGGWLHTIAGNAAYDHLRKQAGYELMLNRSLATQPRADEEFWKKFEAKEARTLINEAVRKLPLRRRQIFQLSKIEGFSRREVAEQLNISENTVRNQLADAVEFVQEYLTKSNIVVFPLSILLILIG